jgi:DNA-binding NarL/FixJ family response regulator
MELKSTIAYNQDLIFTRQECKVLKLAAQGFSNKEIGASLYIEVNTVKRHRQNIMQKAGIVGKIAINKFLKMFD